MMNSSSLLSAVQRTLNNGPCTLEQLWLDHAPLWQQLGWRAEQVSLWLACLPSVHRRDLPSGEHEYLLNGPVDANEIGLP